MTLAHALTIELGGKWYANYGTAACPICQSERRKDQDALTLTNAADGHLLLHCKKLGCNFHDLASTLGVTAGELTKPDPLENLKRDVGRLAEAAKKSRRAQSIWTETESISGSIAEKYLRGRGITGILPDTLRFHQDCWHPTSQRLPAMVALVEGCEVPAVHRTYLRADGSGVASIDPAKAMLGAVGGGAVRLSNQPGPLVVAEGIETALSIACGVLAGPMRLLATLSTSGLRGLRLPATPSQLIIATDGDDPGRAAGNALAERAVALGWMVSMLPAPEGLDWNDCVTGTKVRA